MILWLLGISAWIKKGAYALLCGIKRYPLHAALIASLCLSGWLWRGKQGALAERDFARVQFADCLRAGIKAREAQIALNTQTKAKYEAAAEKADHDYRIALADADRRTDDYIARNRVRKAGGSGASVANAPAEVQAAGVPEGLPADAVMVSAEDVRICTANSIYALKAHEWGDALVKAGVAN